MQLIYGPACPKIKIVEIQSSHYPMQEVTATLLEFINGFLQGVL